MSKALRESKNNNLAIYRERQTKINEALIQRAIEYILDLKGTISFSLVSKVTYDIADATKYEKGISLAGISKSKIYRPMVEKAQLASESIEKNVNIATKQKVSVGDMQMSFHSLRIENAKLKMENKVVQGRLREVQIPKQELGNIDMNIMKQYEEMKQVCSSLISRLIELDLAYVDAINSTLNVAVYDETIISKQSLELFYKEELDAIRN